MSKIAVEKGLNSTYASATIKLKANLKSETALTLDSAAATTTANRVYPVVLDKSGYLAVNVPWESLPPVTSEDEGKVLKVVNGQ